MAKVITVDDIRLVSIKFGRDSQNNIAVDADYLYRNQGVVIPGLNILVYSERDRLVSSYPTNVQQAMATLNTYYEGLIETAEGIS